MVKIRLSRGGAKGRPFYHIVVADERKARDGRRIERVGFFNPVAAGKEVRLQLDTDKVRAWVSKGAQMTDKVRLLVKEADKQAGTEAKQPDRCGDVAASERQLLVGKIVGLHGVQGWVKLESYTEPRAKIFDYQPWQINAAGRESEIDNVHGREQGKGLIGKLSGYDDRDAAATLIGASIRIPRSQLPSSSPGEYYWADLEGLDVVTLDGVALGSVSHLFATGANDVLVVKDATRERLIPFVSSQFIAAVDMENARITVDWDPEF